MTMHPEERLLGFDAREMWLDFDAGWPPERKELFLLRVDVDKPLSTDTMVWPSVFELEEGLEGPPPWEAFDLWVDPKRMKAGLKARRESSTRRYWLMAVTLRSGTFPEGAMTFGYPTLDPLAMPSDSRSWTLLGYDVSDASFLSGLSNCGYAQEEIASLRERWGPHLNRYHLFAEDGPAMTFQTMSDGRVPEHAPFFVYGLYRIEEHLK